MTLNEDSLCLLHVIFREENSLSVAAGGNGSEHYHCHSVTQDCADLIVPLGEVPVLWLKLNYSKRANVDRLPIPGRRGRFVSLEIYLSEHSLLSAASGECRELFVASSQQPALRLDDHDHLALRNLSCVTIHNQPGPRLKTRPKTHCHDHCLSSLAHYYPSAATCRRWIRLEIPVAGGQRARHIFRHHGRRRRRWAEAPSPQAERWRREDDETVHARSE